MSKFIPMKPYKLSKDELSKVRFPVYVQPKFDGWRVVIKEGKALTYALKPIPNHWIRTELERIFGGLGYFLIDGEGLLMNEKATYQDIQSAYSTREGKPEFRFVMFDALCFDHNKNWYYCNRMQHLDSIKYKLDFPQFSNKHNNIESIQLQHYVMENVIQVNREVERRVNQGWEGVIVRDYNGLYKFGRSTLNSQELLAYKPYTDAEARILSCYRQEMNINEPEIDNHGHTKRGHSKAGKVTLNTLGGFRVVGINGRFNGVTFDVGSGFKEAQRKQYWNDLNLMAGCIIKYKYQDVGSMDKPRQPIFLGFRNKEDM